MRNPLLPGAASNQHSLHPVIVVVFGLVTAISLGRSIAHVVLPDGGANTIATIITFSGTPDPDPVIHFVFGLWGLAQLGTALLFVIVLLRYRNLIPLMWVFILGEYGMRIVLGRVLKPLGPEYFGGTAPGEIGNYVLVPLAALMLLWSVLGATETKRA